MDPFSEQMKTPPPSKWYEKWWVILLIILLAIILIVGLGFGLAIFYFKKNIEAGSFYNPATGEFTDELPMAPSNDPKNVVEVSVDDDPYLGSVYAPVTIIAFEDFQCPFCKEVQPIIKQVIDRYGDQVLFVYRDFPLIGVHADAQNSAEASECAHEQNKFWEYHDLLFANQSRQDIASLKNHAVELGLDSERFNQCLDSRKYEQEVTADLRDALAAGVDATPTWFINGVKYRGVLNVSMFETLINAEIKYGGQ